MTEILDSGENRIPALGGKRILLLFPHMVTSGGALYYNLRLAGQLQEQGAVVAILTMQVDRQSFELPAGVEVISLGGPLTSSLGYWLLLPYWQVRIDRAINAWRPDLLVPQVFPSNWWGWLYKRKQTKMTLFWVCHEPSAFIHSQAWIHALRPWWKSFLARSLRPLLARVDVSLSRYCDRTVANSRFTAAEMERVYAILPDGIAYPGIDLQKFSQGDHLKERSILTVARLTKFKRIDFLLEVFAAVVKVHPDLTYVIVGTGEDEALLRKQTEQLGLNSQVIFTGALDDHQLTERYQRSSLFLHGSVDEPFGMAPLEAIACGTPVVAHNSGGLREFVSRDCGRLVDSLSYSVWAQEIADYLNLLAANPHSSQRVQECARPFDWQHSLQPALKIIDELCQKESPKENHERTS